ncbi:MAG: universal stress protein [Nitrospirae bacterium]|nr:universal stress protein [Nitrospirota bacterium]
MARYRKILVAVDGSDSSRNAFCQACKIVRDDKSWITVITVIPLYQDQIEVLSIKEKVARKLREEGEKIISEIGVLARQEDVFIRTYVEEGVPFQSIIDFAEDGGYDLIVTGRHGITRFEKALIGNVAARIIGHSSRDVLVIPGNSSVGWNSIVFATDGSRYSSAAADKAMDLAKSYNGNIKVICSVDVTDEFLAQAPEVVERMVKEAKVFTQAIKEKADALNINIETFVREGETFRVITDLAKQANADVIVMGSHGRTGIKKILMGSVTEKVIGYAPCPVLIVR